MTDLASVVALALILRVGLPGDPAPEHRLPRSSIAAVLAQRRGLVLSDADVKALEERDAALQKHLSEIHELYGPNERSAPGERGTSSGRRARSDALPARSPSEDALPEGAAGANEGQHKPGGRQSGRHGARSGADGHPEDPASRAARLQTQLDNADTEAWFAAELLLPEEKRARARDVAEKYREALADAREAARGAR